MRCLKRHKAFARFAKSRRFEPAALRCVKICTLTPTSTPHLHLDFSLAAYKGQTVRLQFRNTMDSSITSTFRIDDVSLK